MDLRSAVNRKTLFPGEGRGPVATRIGFSSAIWNWAPAFAGEQQQVTMV